MEACKEYFSFVLEGVQVADETIILEGNDKIAEVLDFSQNTTKLLKHLQAKSVSKSKTKLFAHTKNTMRHSVSWYFLFHYTAFTFPSPSKFSSIGTALLSFTHILFGASMDFFVSSQ